MTVDGTGFISLKSN